MTIIILIIISHEAYIHMDTDQKDGSSGQILYLSWKRQWKCYNTVSTKAFSFIVVYDQISNLLNNVTQWKSNQEEE